MRTRVTDKIIVLYPGTFDPITKGHKDVLETCGRLFDRVIIGMANNIKKKTMFTMDERYEMIRDVINKDISYPHSGLFEIDTLYDELTVDYNWSRSGNYINGIVRGIRNNDDFNKELLLSFNNNVLGESKLRTIFIPALQENLHISSSAVREILSFNEVERLSNYLCPSTLEYIIKKDNKKIG